MLPIEERLKPRCNAAEQNTGMIGVAKYGGVCAKRA